MFRFRDKSLIVIFILLSHLSFAQTSTVSNPDDGRLNNPYSKYGIGTLVDGNNVALKGMADITSAFANPNEVNTDNPASYAFLQKTTFEGGFTGSELSIVSATGPTYKTGTATLNYLNIGMPFNSHKVAMCIGLRPISNVFYSLVDTIVAPGTGQTQRAYSGEGSINYAFIGLAARHKGFSAGFNFGYMFGTIVKNTSVTSVDTNVIYRSNQAEFPNYNQIGGIYWKGGIMYEHKLRDSSYSIRIGGTLALSQRLTERFTSYQISSYNFGDTTVNDTTVNSGTTKGKLTLPATYSIGAILTKTDKWSAGIDYRMTQWSGYHSSGDTSINYGIASSSYRISLGGEHFPKTDSRGGFFSKATYRMGIYYGKDYLQINGSDIPYYGVTFGGSFPLKRYLRSISNFHSSLEIGKLGSTSNGLIEEIYVRFSLGISFSDQWFIPRKYD